MLNYKTLDIEEVRVRLPVMKPVSLKISMLWSCFSNLIGKDVSRFSLPVFLNEPMTVLQKGAEMSYFAKRFFTKAVQEQDPCMRMLHVAAYSAATYCFVKGRTSKPFNPLLGETFEVVTPDFRFLAEQVSHHPPVASVYS